MKSQSYQVRCLRNEIAACTRLVSLCVKSAVIKLVDLENKLEIEMSKQLNLCNVATSCSPVVVDLNDKSIAYVIQSGFDMGWVYSVKKFNPIGQDIRMLHFGSVDGEKITPKSDEYEAVIKAAFHSNKALIAYGCPGHCLYPECYNLDSL